MEFDEDAFGAACYARHDCCEDEGLLCPVKCALDRMQEAVLQGSDFCIERYHVRLTAMLEHDAGNCAHSRQLADRLAHYGANAGGLRVTHPAA